MILSRAGASRSESCSQEGIPMRVLSVSLALVIVCSANSPEPYTERAKKQLQSDDYMVTWGVPAIYEPDAELEIGDGNGHGGTLGWLRFQPRKDGVEVLSIQFDEGWRPYRSK